MTISVIIPTLNEARNIAPLLDALLAQNFPASTRSARENEEIALLEIIVCDGESSDETPNIAREYSQRDGRVQLLQSVRGVSRQRNFGAKNARGELLIFLDCDTRPAPDFLARVARSYQRIPFAAACPCFCAISKNSFRFEPHIGFSMRFL